MSRIEHYQKYHFRYEATAIVLFFFLNNTLLATSRIMEASRRQTLTDLDYILPFVDEYSSAIGMLVSIACLVWFLKIFELSWSTIRQRWWIFILVSIPFSLIHVGIMVGIRALIFPLFVQNYQFGEFWFEIFYEYRKDLWSYLAIIAAIKSYEFIVSRLYGEANLIAEGEEQSDAPEDINIDRLLVKKLGKEFIIKVDDIEWLESAGNYVNLHLKQRIYPMRITLNKLIAQLEEKGFSRVHRSYGVNLDFIESIAPQPSGDAQITLKCGKVLSLSRRYKDQFKSVLQS